MNKYRIKIRGQNKTNTKKKIAFNATQLIEAANETTALFLAISAVMFAIESSADSKIRLSTKDLVLNINDIETLPDTHEKNISDSKFSMFLDYGVAINTQRKV